MPRRRRTAVTVAGDREAMAIAATLGGDLRESRRRKGWTLDEVARRVGLSVPRLSEIERGLGANLPLQAWVRLGIAVDRPLAIRLTAPTLGERLADSGHLALQEWVLRLGRRHGWDAGLEVPTRPADPRFSVDVLLRAWDRLLVLECWNTIRDFGAAVRSTQRKLVEAEDLAVAFGAARVHGCWLVRPTAANHELVRAYPEAIRARFTNSVGWVRALERGEEPPRGLGFVWLDPTVGLRALRIPGSRA